MTVSERGGPEEGLLPKEMELAITRAGRELDDNLLRELKGLDPEEENREEILLEYGNWESFGAWSGRNAAAFPCCRCSACTCLCHRRERTSRIPSL